MKRHEDAYRVACWIYTPILDTDSTVDLHLEINRLFSLCPDNPFATREELLVAFAEAIALTKVGVLE